MIGKIWHGIISKGIIISMDFMPLKAFKTHDWAGSGAYRLLLR